MLNPPDKYIKRIGHHWIRLKSDTTEYQIVQWNPGSKTWTHSNGHDCYGSTPLILDGWEWVSYVPYPFEEDSK